MNRTSGSTCKHGRRRYGQILIICLVANCLDGSNMNHTAVCQCYLSVITVPKCCCVLAVRGVTQLHDVVYMVCSLSSAILRFNATTRQQLADIGIKALRDPSDIVACEQTYQLYVADHPLCVWRVSADGADIKLWLTKSSTDTFEPTTLSVTSTRLLVTSRNTKQLIQLDSVGDELRRVQLPDNMEPWQAVESPTATFIVSHENVQAMQWHINTNVPEQWQISEFNTDGQALRQFTGSHPLGRRPHIAIDSLGNVFVADYRNRGICLLDAQLRLRRLIIDELQLNNRRPLRLCYREPTGQLLVALPVNSIAVFDVLCR